MPVPDRFSIPDGVKVRKYGEWYEVWKETRFLYRNSNKLEARRGAAEHAELYSLWNKFLNYPAFKPGIQKWFRMKDSRRL